MGTSKIKKRHLYLLHAALQPVVQPVDLGVHAGGVGHLGGAGVDLRVRRRQLAFELRNLCAQQHTLDASDQCMDTLGHSCGDWQLQQ